MANRETQVSGNHYDKKISPIEYIEANKMDFDDGNVVKYISRYEDKNEAVDVIKAIHYCMFILRNKYNISSTFVSLDENGAIVKELNVKK